MKHTPVFILGAALIALPALTYAGPIIRSGETVSVDASQVLLSDFYAAGGVVTISGKAEGDAYLAGGTVTVNAPITGDLTVAGGSVQVHGTIGDDLRVIGGDITIADSVKGDVVIVGGLLTLLSTATVEGDVIFIGGEVAVEGSVLGTVHGTADRVRVNGSVGGDIAVTAGSVTLGDNADVMGNITYTSRNDMTRAQDARVSGDVRKVDVVFEADGSLLKTYLMWVAVLAFAALSLYAVARGRISSLTESTAGNPGFSGLIGLGILLVTPFVASVLLVSVIGSLLGLTLMLGYLLMLALAAVLSGTVLGFLAQKFLFSRRGVTMGSIVFGTVLFTLMGFVPYIGALLILALVTVTLGGIGTALYRGIRA